jgi:hypothetical protein
MTLQQQVIEALVPAPTLLTENIISWKPLDGYDFTYYVKFFPEDIACNVTVGGKHDVELVTAFLSDTTAESLLSVTKENPFVLTHSAALKNTPFHNRLILHPSIEDSELSDATSFMNSKTYSTAAVYKNEFLEDDTIEETYLRCENVNTALMDREPSPAISARFTLGAIVKTQYKQPLGVYSYKKIQRHLWNVKKSGGFMDVQNFERKEVHIEIEDDICEITADGDTWSQNMDTFSLWFKTYLLEGLDKSMDVL